MDGVDYESLDDEPAHLFFMIAAPAGGADVHLEVLSRLSRMLMDDDFRDALMQLRRRKNTFRRSIKPKPNRSKPKLKKLRRKRLLKKHRLKKRLRLNAPSSSVLRHAPTGLPIPTWLLKFGKQGSCRWASTSKSKPTVPAGSKIT